MIELAKVVFLPDEDHVLNFGDYIEKEIVGDKT